MIRQDKIMFIDILECVVDVITYVMWGFLIVLLGSHLVSRIHLLLKKSLNLNQQSLVVITGACMGIGQQMVIQIAKLYHCRIIIVDIRKDLFTSIEQQLKSLGATVSCKYCDLSEDKSVQELIQFLNKKAQRIDLFIHNAGIPINSQYRHSHPKESPKYFIYRVNLISPVKIIRQTIKLTEGGHIAIVASMIAMIQGGLDVSTYASTKAALYSFGNCFRQQLMAQNINITLSMGCPYMIQTGMFLGFKTKLDLIVRQLQPQYVAKRLVREFVQKKQVCHIYQYEAMMFKIVNLFPSQLWDLLSLKFNVSNFQQIRNKHNHKINKGS